MIEDSTIISLINPSRSASSVRSSKVMDPDLNSQVLMMLTSNNRQIASKWTWERV